MAEKGHAIHDGHFVEIGGVESREFAAGPVQCVEFPLLFDFLSDIPAEGEQLRDPFTVGTNGVECDIQERQIRVVLPMDAKSGRLTLECDGEGIGGFRSDLG
jgi:hypothetical protein